MGAGKKIAGVGLVLAVACGFSANAWAFAFTGGLSTVTAPDGSTGNGTTPANAFLVGLTTSGPDAGSYVFTAPNGTSLTNGWYDPPTVKSYTYSLSGGDFTSFTLQAGYSAQLANGTTVSGTTYDFTTPVTSFVLSNLSPTVLLANAGSGFAIQLGFSGNSSQLVVTPNAVTAPSAVPLPAAWSLFGGGVAALAGYARRRARRRAALRHTV